MTLLLIFLIGVGVGIIGVIIFGEVLLRISERQYVERYEHWSGQITKAGRENRKRKESTDE
jgi:hypothetical protein